MNWVGGREHKAGMELKRGFDGNKHRQWPKLSSNGTWSKAEGEKDNKGHYK